MSTTTSTKANGQKGKHQVKRPRQEDQICGAYNHTGCMHSAEKCRFDHEYSQWAGVLFYQSLTKPARDWKGLKLNSYYPKEFKDLRNRSIHSLTTKESLALLKMPLLVPDEEPKSAQAVSKPRKKAKKEPQADIDKESEAKDIDKEAGVKLNDVESEIKAPQINDVESEIKAPQLTRQEREAALRAEAEESIIARLMAATGAAYRADRCDVTKGEQQAIIDEVEADLNMKLIALEEEYVLIAGVCYMQQEMLESKGSQDDQVLIHRFRMVTPGALGVFKPGELNCNTENKEALWVLVKNLNKMLMLDNEDREDGFVGYKCCNCLRSLYRNQSGVGRVMCACLRCISVLYCCATCKKADAREHRFSCFMHPGWECEESTKQRVEKMRVAGVAQKPSTDADVQELEPVGDSYEDSNSGDEGDTMSMDGEATPPGATPPAEAAEQAAEQAEAETAPQMGQSAEE